MAAVACSWIFSEACWCCYIVYQFFKKGTSGRFPCGLRWRGICRAFDIRPMPPRSRTQRAAGSRGQVNRIGGVKVLDHQRVFDFRRSRQQVDRILTPVHLGRRRKRRGAGADPRILPTHHPRRGERGNGPSHHGAKRATASWRARDDYPVRSPFYPYMFHLEPVSLKTLAKFVVAESPEVWPDWVPADEKAKIMALATEDTGATVVRVGELYAELIQVLSNSAKVPEDEFRGDFIRIRRLSTNMAAATPRDRSATRRAGPQRFGGRDARRVGRSRHFTDRRRRRASRDRRAGRGDRNRGGGV